MLNSQHPNKDLLTAQAVTNWRRVDRSGHSSESQAHAGTIDAAWPTPAVNISEKIPKCKGKVQQNFRDKTKTENQEQSNKHFKEYVKAEIEDTGTRPNDYGQEKLIFEQNRNYFLLARQKPHILVGNWEWNNKGQFNTAKDEGQHWNPISVQE